MESFNYPHVEPYNRQQPYYFESYDSLDKMEFEKFNLYLLKKRDWDSRTHRRLDKFDYNYVWNTVKFDMLIEERYLLEFINSFLNLYNMKDMKDDILDYLD